MYLLESMGVGVIILFYCFGLFVILALRQGIVVQCSYIWLQVGMRINYIFNSEKIFSVVYFIFEEVRILVRRSLFKDGE